MRTIGVLTAVLGLVLYAAWPFWTVNQLTRAVESRNPAAVAEMIDFDRLGISLSRDISSAYLTNVGDERISSQARNIAIGFTASLADPLVAQFVTPGGMITLLSDGWPETLQPRPNIGRHPIGRLDISDAWQAFVSSEYGFGRFSLPLPIKDTPDRQFTL